MKSKEYDMNDKALIWNWVVSDNIDQVALTFEQPVGLCLDLLATIDSEPVLVQFMQKCPECCITALIRSTLLTREQMPALAEQLLGLFFQPCWYTIGDSPFVLADGISEMITSLYIILQAKAREQGFTGVYMISRDGRPVESPGSNQQIAGTGVVGLATASHAPDYTSLLDQWLTSFSHHEPMPIFILVEELAGASQVDELLSSQDALYQQEKVKMALWIFHSGTIIAKQDRELGSFEIREENNRRYLEFQKQDLSKVLAFYRNEYEVLPGWFKKLGHLVKVITGKRTFKSLYNDHVKKYKD